MSRIDLASARQRAIDCRLQQQKDAEELKFWNRQIRVAKALNWVTGVAAALSLLTMGILWFTLTDSRKATEEANRAWLAPIGELMDAPPRLGEGWNTTVQFHNVGKEPALDVQYKFESTTAPGNPELVESGGTGLPTNNVCGRITPYEKGTVVYTEHDYSEYHLIRIDKQEQNNVMSKKTTLVGMGCLAYRTFEKSHRAGFCFYLRPPDPPQHDDWHWCICPRGNTAT
jgi:hypothetical protein